MITIYSHSTNHLSREFWKYLARRLIGKYSGPDAVRDSLLRGLEVIGEEYEINPRRPQAGAAVVLSGTTALTEAIKRKRSGHLKMLIAGPNVVIHPYHHDRLICDPAIDIVLVPSKWTADFWRYETPELADKIRIWSAGVAVTAGSNRSGAPIIYDKIGDETQVQELKAAIPHASIFTYGKFSRSDYLSALASAPFLVYLSRSESQGLALQEAWARDVPTLVNKSTRWKDGELSWEALQINCPYLTPELGRVFTNMEELPILIEQAATLHPKNYTDTHLSDQASAKKLLHMI